MLVALPTVISAVLPALPSVKPLIDEANVMLVTGQVSAEVKLVPLGCTVKVPVVSTVVVTPTLTTSPVSVMLLLLAVTPVPDNLPKLSAGPAAAKSMPAVPPFKVIAPVLASTLVPERNSP